MMIVWSYDYAFNSISTPSEEVFCVLASIVAVLDFNLHKVVVNHHNVSVARQFANDTHSIKNDMYNFCNIISCLR